MYNADGNYFWSTDMVILKDLKKDTIRKGIEEIIEDGYLELAFSKIGTIQSVYAENKVFDEIQGDINAILDR
jgi:hypothetical protein